jgi:hypothetical protein
VDAESTKKMQCKCTQRAVSSGAGATCEHNYRDRSVRRGRDIIPTGCVSSECRTLSSMQLIY